VPDPAPPEGPGPSLPAPRVPPDAPPSSAAPPEGRPPGGPDGGPSPEADPAPRAPAEVPAPASTPAGAPGPAAPAVGPSAEVALPEPPPATDLPLVPVAVGGLALLVAFVAARVLRRRAPAVDEGPGADGAPPPARGGFFAGLARSREALLGRWAAGGTVGDARFEALEEALIAADVGARTATELVDAVRKLGREVSVDALRRALRSELRARVGAPAPLASREDGPLVILVVGVNGSGKTTTIGKLAARYVAEGHKVMLAAGDTFRAGAIEQLRVWAGRAQAQIVASQEGADPAAVIFDAMQAARARGCSVVICDTAGRLQAQSTLMDELAKVVRVMKKADPTAPHEVLLVLDGTMGQNALSQARIFKSVVGVTGVALTKLDGTAKGGVVVAVRAETGLPVKLVGLGEGVADLRDFDPDAFVDALLGPDGAEPPRSP